MSPTLLFSSFAMMCERHYLSFVAVSSSSSLFTLTIFLSNKIPFQRFFGWLWCYWWCHWWARHNSLRKRRKCYHEWEDEVTTTLEASPLRLQMWVILELNVCECMSFSLYVSSCSLFVFSSPFSLSHFYEHTLLALHASRHSFYSLPTFCLFKCIRVNKGMFSILHAFEQKILTSLSLCVFVSYTHIQY